VRASLRLLGGFALEHDGRVVLDRRARPAKAVALVKRLALEPRRALHRERLIDALWPDADAEAGANNLHKLLHQLRRALESAGAPRELVRLEGLLVVLDRSVDVDVDAFRASARDALAEGAPSVAAAEALALYRGDLLPDDLYDEAIDAPRDQLRALAQRLRIAAARAATSAGDQIAAEELLRTALDADPAFEEAHRALIELFLAQGARDRALRQYQACEDVLARELGVAPSAETRALAASARSAARNDSAPSLPQEDGAPDEEASSRTPAEIKARTFDTIERVHRIPATPVFYAHTADGFRLAYSVRGEGFPLVHMSQLPWNHLQREWEIPEWRAWHERLGEGRLYVRYDGRGRGLSQRDGAPTLRVETEAEDLRAVVDALALDHFDLYVGLNNAAAAFLYAARHPGRVRRMVVPAPYAYPRGFVEGGFLEMARDIVRDLRGFCEIAGGVPAEPNPPELISAIVEMTIAAADQPFVASWYDDAFWDADVSELLPAVRAPVLALAPAGNVSIPLHEMERVVALLPDAQLVETKTPYLPLGVFTEETVPLIRNFLDHGIAEAPAMDSAAGKAAYLDWVRHRGTSAEPVLYAATADGIRVAYTMTGEGFPLVHMSKLPWSHLQFESDVPAWRYLHQCLGEGRLYVRYDGRGRGLSQRDGARVRLEGEVEDLRAVVDALGIERFDLYGGLNNGAAALAFAARYPGRVRRMALPAPFAYPASFIRQEFLGSWREAVADYDTYCETAGGLSVQPHSAELTEEMVRFARVGSGREFCASWYDDEYMALDVRPELPRVTAPVLAINSEGFMGIPRDEMMRVVGALPDARLVDIDAPYLPVGACTDDVVRVIRGFLDEGLCETNQAASCSGVG
jgi:DNA-binding SARP family transcriptional activator/pimeloyl-ACP methyl ester carboxylesterase